MLRRLILTVSGCAAIAACGSKTAPAPPSTEPPPVGERIIGTERLGWDELAADAADLATIRYAIYVDGARSELADAACATPPAAAGFACSGRLPTMSAGAHTLELAAFILDGTTVLESARSSVLQVIVTGTTTTSAASKAVWQSGSIVTTKDNTRLRLDLVADGLDDPTDLAFAPDGRIFVAERSGRVRVVRDGRLQPQPALALDDVSTAGGGGLLSLALDPRFERTRFVYAVYTAPSRSGGTMFVLARFREAADTLADRAIFLDDIPASPTRAAASVRFGGDGKLYAAFDDGGNPRLAGDLASFNGKVLRMNADGSTPDDQAASPVYSDELRSPRGFDWQPSTGTLWIADGGPEHSARLCAVMPEEGRRRRGVVQARYELPAETGPSAVAFYRGDRVPALHDNLLIAAERGRYILRVRFDPHNPARILTSERLLNDRVGNVRVIAAGTDGAIYFCTPNALARLAPG
jgi:glucose/arabinose dehydrogenase